MEVKKMAGDCGRRAQWSEKICGAGTQDDFISFVARYTGAGPVHTTSVRAGRTQQNNESPALLRGRRKDREWSQTVGFFLSAFGGAIAAWSRSLPLIA